MRIDRITLENFRVFEKRVVEFHPKFNVIIGNNGIGKTSLLEAITVSLSPFLNVVTGKDRVRNIKHEDIKFSAYAHNKEAKLYCAVLAKGEMPDNQDEWQIVRERLDWGFMRSDTSRVTEATRELIRKVIEGDDKVELPLVKYYGAIRFISDKEKAVKDEFKGKSSRLDAYTQALNASSGITQFTRWFKGIELSSLQDKQEFQRIAVMVKRSIAKCIPGCSELRYDLHEDLICAQFENSEEWVPLTSLSDGQKTVMGLIGDLLYRCFILNPQMGEESPAKTSGIVLIDELDIHLHPNWQRKIVGMLKDIFPNIQFITTTHSPFIVQSLKNEELIDLQGKKMSDDYRKRGIEEIVEEEMGVHEANRSEHFLEMKRVAKEYYNLILEGEKPENSNKIKALKEKLDILLIPFYDDPAYVTYLESYKHLLNKHETNQ